MKKYLIIYVLFIINLNYSMNVNFFNKLSTFVKNKSEIFSASIMNFSKSTFDKISST